MSKKIACGKYDCNHCSVYGRCTLSFISIDKNGRCSQFLNKNTNKCEPVEDEDLYPYTNRC